MDTIIEQKKWTKKKIATISGIGFLAILLIYLIFIKDNSSILSVNKEHLLISEVTEGQFMEYIPVDAKVAPKTMIFIDAILGGIIEKIYVEDGDTVQKGTALLKLQNTEMELRFMEQETRIFDAINNLQNTKLLLDRDKYTRQKEIVDLQYKLDKLKTDFLRKQVLFDKQVIPLKEYEDARRDYDYNIKQLQISLKLAQIDSLSYKNRNKQILNSIKRMYGNIELLHKSIDNLIVKAPATGELSSFKAELGQTIQSGEHIGQINGANGYKLQANIDERYIARIKKGQKAEYTAENGKKYSLTVSKIYTDVVKGSFLVEMRFDSIEPPHIKKGQSLQLRLILSEAQKALMLKRGAFFQSSGGNWVYVLSSDKKSASKKAVEIGRQNIYYYEILEGLKPGDEVIISSYETFGDKDVLVFE